MNNKLLLAILIFLFVITSVFFYRINQNSYNINLTNSQSQTNINSNYKSIIQQDLNDQNPQNPNLISLSELSSHNSLTDCWVGYGGKIYDITSFLPNHPGSASAISPYCGTEKEFTNAFTKKHGTSKVNNLMRVGVFIGDFDIIGRI